MKLVKAYNSVSLVLRIVIGMVIGAALALLIPNAAVTAPGIGILGTLFVGALKAIAPLLVFVLIISALAQLCAGNVGINSANVGISSFALLTAITHLYANA